MSKAQQINPSSSIESLLANAASLKIQDIEALMQELNGILYRKKSKSKIFREKELLRRINEAVLEKTNRERYWQLALQLEEGTMAEPANREFMQLVEKEESLRNTRVQLMVELSQLRNVPLPQIMEEMGLTPLVHG